VVIDDGSRDSTAKKAEEAGASVIRLPYNLGVGGALRLGFKYAIKHGFDSVVQIDADGQHPVNEIRHLIAVAERTNSDMVIGSRFHTGTPTMHVGFVRRFAMVVMAHMATRATGSTMTDVTSGFRVIREPLLGAFSEKFAANYLGDTFEAVVAAGRGGYRVIETEATLRPRQIGQSSASPLQAATFSIKALVVAVLHLHPRIRPRRPDVDSDEE
jgi:glycosyltransferase involved in cell wall biosynthesis